MAPAQAQESAERERLIKTAFIYNIAKFTRWPENAADQASATLSLCIAGEDELVDALGQLRGKTIKGRPLAIQTLKTAQVPKNCEILYVAGSKRSGQLDLIGSAGGQPTLTVSELPGFGRNGGMVELYREEGRVRFIINLGAARAAGLEISPRLLNLAVVIGQE